MPAKWIDVYMGFEFVSADGGLRNQAFVSKTTGHSQEANLCEAAAASASRRRRVLHSFPAIARRR